MERDIEVVYWCVYTKTFANLQISNKSINLFNLRWSRVPVAEGLRSEEDTGRCNEAYLVKFISSLFLNSHQTILSWPPGASCYWHVGWFSHIPTGSLLLCCQHPVLSIHIQYPMGRISTVCWTLQLTLSISENEPIDNLIQPMTASF